MNDFSYDLGYKSRINIVPVPPTYFELSATRGYTDFYM